MISEGHEMEVSNALSIAVEANERIKAGGNPDDIYLEVCDRNSERSTANNCGPNGCNVLMGLDGIWNYGCWCNFGDDLTEGFGAPVNRFDEICRDYQLCLRCAKWDAKQSGTPPAVPYTCDPLTDTYAAISGADFNVQCTLANNADPNNHCGTHLCTCNYNFFKELIQEIWAQTPYDSTPLHSNGWDRDDHCIGSSNGGGGGGGGTGVPGPKQDLRCCGHYPDRFPYNADIKSCCDKKEIYNPINKKCCADGTVDLIGNC